MRRVDRIVIDEAHVVLNKEKDFRPEMQRFGRLMVFKTQMVLLTVTFIVLKQRIPGCLALPNLV